MIGQRQSGFAGKRTSLLQRRQDLTEQAFREHWAGPHADIACAMPGIWRYTQNRVTACVWRPADPALRYDCDGIVELEFRDEQAVAEADASDAVRTRLPEDEPHFLDGITLCRVPAGARQTWPGMTKVMLAARLADASASGFAALEHALACSAGAQVSIEPVHESFHRPRLRHEDEPPHAFATLWFPVGHDLRATFALGSAWDRAAGAGLHRAAAWCCDALPIVVDGHRATREA